MSDENLLPVGTLVSVVRKSLHAGEDALAQAYIGGPFTITAAESAAEHNGNLASYDLEGPEGDPWWTYAEDVEIFLSKEQAAQRKPPSMEQVQEFVSRELLTTGDDFDIDESQIQDGGYVVISGQTNEGLDFEVGILVHYITEVP